MYYVYLLVIYVLTVLDSHAPTKCSRSGRMHDYPAGNHRCFVAFPCTKRIWVTVLSARLRLELKQRLLSHPVSSLCLRSQVGYDSRVAAFLPAPTNTDTVGQELVWSTSTS